MLFLFGLCLSLLLQQCAYDEKPHKITVGNVFSLEMPEYLEPATDINAEALLQYHSYFRNFYVMADTFSLDELPDLDSLVQQTTVALLPLLKDSLVETAKDTLLNGYTAKYQTIIGVVGDRINQRIRYEHFYIRSKRYYHLVIWVWDDRFTFHEEAINAIFASFKED
ncbi:MAG: hypothetical protein R2798_10280 [Chitinophagales bacterium]|nr:hypothetical protein [Bacteroidota bacterium]MCB9044050.1 hypothetical protein [Chitinophagales bacterium]